MMNKVLIVDDERIEREDIKCLFSPEFQEQEKEKKECDFLVQYFLQNYLYTGSQEILNKAEEIVDLEQWKSWHRILMIETDKNFFDSGEKLFSETLMDIIHRKFYYLNMGATQSLLFFSDIYCDYLLVAKHVYQFLKQKYIGGFYVGVSRHFEEIQEMPTVLDELEELLEGKFYNSEKHVFSKDEEEEYRRPTESQDSQIMQKISEDIRRKNPEQLRKHFRILADKYREKNKYSAMYIKFVFSSVIQELYQENQFAGERRLEQEIDRLYRCNNMSEVLALTENNITQFEEFLERSMKESKGGVAAVKNYVYQHYGENLGIEMLAEKVHLSSGYLSYIFKKETGMNLNRFIRVFRMEKAKEFLGTTNMKVVQVSEAVGFSNVSYFCRSFREYYGRTPESYRKRTGGHEELPL